MLSSVQFSSFSQSCLILCDPMNRSTPGPPIHHQLPEFTQSRIHRVSDAIQPSHPLSSPSPPAPNPSQHQRLLRTAPWWGSASEAQNTSASTPHGLFLKGSSVYKTRQTDLCSEADDFHSNVMCTTTLKGHTLQEKFNYLKLNLS